MRTWIGWSARHKWVSRANARDAWLARRAARALALHFPPIQRVADVSERIEDLSDVPDATLEEMRAIRDAARQKNE